MKKYLKKNANYISTDMSLIDKYSEKGFFIVSVYKSDCCEKENKNKQKELRSFIQSQGLRFIEICGHWENERNISIRNREERFLFVPFEENASNIDIHALAAFTMAKFSQEIIIFYDPASTILLYKEGHVSEINDFNFKKICEEFFKNKEINYSGRRFVIDGRSIPKGFFKVLTFRNRGYIF